MTDHYLTLNNFNLHYIEKLPKGGNAERTIIFIHGRALSTESWEQQFISETLSCYRLIALDLPGHGRSDHSHDFNQAYSVTGFKDILVRFIDGMEITNYILVGLSLGGHIALQSLPYLQNCKGVFAMTMPITKPVQPSSMYLDLDLLGKVFRECPIPADVTTYTSMLLRPNANQIPLLAEQSYYEADPRIHTGILNSLLAGAHLDEIEIIKNSNITIAVVAGSQDQIHNLAYLDSFDLPVWRGSFHYVPSCGHLLPWENPKEVNTLLKEFTEECFSAFR